MYTLENFCMDVSSESKRRDALIFAWKGFKLPEKPTVPTKEPDDDAKFLLWLGIILMVISLPFLLGSSTPGQSHLNLIQKYQF